MGKVLLKLSYQNLRWSLKSSCSGGKENKVEAAGTFLTQGCQRNRTSGRRAIIHFRRVRPGGE